MICIHHIRIYKIDINKEIKIELSASYFLISSNKVLLPVSFKLNHISPHPYFYFLTQNPYLKQLNKFYTTANNDSVRSILEKILSLFIFIIIIYLFKVDDIAKILHAQKIYIKLSNTRI